MLRFYGRLAIEQTSERSERGRSLKDNPVSDRLVTEGADHRQWMKGLVVIMQEIATRLAEKVIQFI